MQARCCCGIETSGEEAIVALRGGALIWLWGGDNGEGTGMNDSEVFFGKVGVGKLWKSSRMIWFYLGSICKKKDPIEGFESASTSMTWGYI